MHGPIDTGCPITYQTRQFFNNFTTDTYRHNCTADTFLFISHTTNVLLFKSRCNIFIGFGIIKELPGLVRSGSPYIILIAFPQPKKNRYVNALHYDVLGTVSCLRVVLRFVEGKLSVGLKAVRTVCVVEASCTLSST